MGAVIFFRSYWGGGIIPMGQPCTFGSLEMLPVLCSIIADLHDILLGGGTALWTKVEATLSLGLQSCGGSSSPNDLWNCLWGPSSFFLKSNACSYFLHFESFSLFSSVSGGSISADNPNPGFCLDGRLVHKLISLQIVGHHTLRIHLGTCSIVLQYGQAENFPNP